jgi:hypothetical protein
MASVEDGVALLSFGTTTVTGYVVESVSEPTTSEELVISDEDGQVITHINNFGVRTDVELTVIPKSGTAVPSVGDTFTYTSETHGSKKFTITEISVESVSKDVTRWTLKGPRFPGITIT